MKFESNFLFFRCNAAGILDLRNLIDDEKNETAQKIKPLESDHDFLYDTNILKDEVTPRKFSSGLQKSPYSTSSIHASHSSSIPTKISDSTKENAAKSSFSSLNLENSKPVVYSNTRKPHINNIEQLLNDYLNFSKALSLKNPSEILNDTELNRKFLNKVKEYSNNLNTLNQLIKSNYSLDSVEAQRERARLQEMSKKLTSIITYLSSTPKTNKSKQYTKTSKTVTTTTKPKIIPSTTKALPTKEKISPESNAWINNGPTQYKLKINDTLSKNFIENLSFRSKFGLKPDEKINILLIKRPTDQDETKKYINENNLLNDNFDDANNIIVNKQPSSSSSNNNNINSNYNYNYNVYSTTKSTTMRPNYFSTPIVPFRASATTLSWLSKLKNKLATSLYVDNRFQPTESYDWSYVFSEQYKQGLDLSFKCPRDGLFSHPRNCAQFLQCVYYGTVHERFYVSNCPAGLYFNQRLELCDYPQNVFCIYK